MDAADFGVILAVEDDPVDGLLVRDALAHWPELKFEYRAVETLEEAVTALAEDGAGFVAVLLDPNLPDSDGFDTLHAVCKAAPKTPVIVVSDYGDAEMSLQGCREGAAAYFFKRDLNTGSGARILAGLLVAAARVHSSR